DQVIDNLIRNQLPALHERPGLDADWGIVEVGLAEQSAGGDVRQPEPAAEQSGLRPFAAAWRAEKDHTHVGPPANESPLASWGRLPTCPTRQPARNRLSPRSGQGSFA